MKKASHNLNLRDILQNTWSILLKTVKVNKNKKSLRKCYSQEESEETQGLKVMQYPRWDPETEKGH